MPLENTGKTIIALRPLKQVVRIVLDKETINVSPSRFTDRYLYVGKVLTEEEYQHLLDDSAITKYERYVHNLFAKGLYTTKQIKDKLYARGAKRWMVEDILAKLSEYQLLNDDLYIKERFEYGHAQLEGYDRIFDDLLIKGIDTEKLQLVIYNEQLELDKAKQLWTRLQNLYSQKSTLARHSAYHDWYTRRGYRHQVIAKIIEDNEIHSIEQENTNLKRDLMTARRKYQHEKGRKKYDRLFRYLAQKGYNYSSIKTILGAQDDESMD